MEIASIIDDIEANMTKVEQYNRLGEEEKAALAWAKVKEGLAALRAATAPSQA